MYSTLLSSWPIKTYHTALRRPFASTHFIENGVNTVYRADSRSSGNGMRMQSRKASIDFKEKNTIPHFGRKEADRIMN